MSELLEQSEPAAGTRYVRDSAYPAPESLIHVSIVSGQNYEASLLFYQTVLNMRVVYEIHGRVRFTALSFDDENHRIGLIERAELQSRPSDATRIEHSSWRYRSLSEALATVRHVEKELRIFPNAVHQGPMISISYQDPDKNRCELIVDCMPTQDEIITFYHETLAEDPGFDTLMPFDLRGMLEREAAGEPLEHLQSYTWVRDNLPPLTSSKLF